MAKVRFNARLLPQKALPALRNLRDHPRRGRCSGGFLRQAVGIWASILWGVRILIGVALVELVGGLKITQTQAHRLVRRKVARGCLPNHHPDVARGSCLARDALTHRESSADKPHRLPPRGGARSVGRPTGATSKRLIHVVSSLQPSWRASRIRSFVIGFRSPSCHGSSSPSYGFPGSNRRSRSASRAGPLDRASMPSSPMPSSCGRMDLHQKISNTKSNPVERGGELPILFSLFPISLIQLPKLHSRRRSLPLSNRRRQDRLSPRG